MKWYAAHLVMYVKFRKDLQSDYPIWENIVLLKAKNEDDAFQKASERGLSDEGDDDATFRWNSKPASWVFGGIRKLTLCEDSTARPNDGTEVTFLEMHASTKCDLERFISGEPVSMKFVEHFRDDVEGDAPPTIQPTGQKRAASTATRKQSTNGSVLH